MKKGITGIITCSLECNAIPVFPSKRAVPSVYQSVRYAALLVSQNQHDAPHTSVPSADETVRGYHHISWNCRQMNRITLQGVQRKTEAIRFAVVARSKTWV
jgi:hypothetical protein